jgi:hypothetical protein
MSNIITSATLRVAKARRAMCVALSLALQQHNAADTDKSEKGRKAMERIGSMILASVANIAGKSVKFYNVDTMLSYLNTAKQSAQSTLNESTVVNTAFLTECQRLAWRKIHADTIDAVETFQAEWKDAKGVEVKHEEAVTV